MNRNTLNVEGNVMTVQVTWPARRKGGESKQITEREK